MAASWPRSLELQTNLSYNGRSSHEKFVETLCSKELPSALMWHQNQDEGFSMIGGFILLCMDWVGELELFDDRAAGR